MSIRLRLTLWYSMILTTTLLVFGVSFYWLFSTTTINQYKQNLREHAEKVQTRLGFALSMSLRGLDLNIKLDAVDHFLSKEVYLQVVNLTNLRDIKRSDNAEQSDMVIPLTDDDLYKLRQQQAFFERATIQGHPFLVYYRPLIYDGNVVGVLQAATYTGNMLNDFTGIFVPSALVTVLLAFSFGWFLARKSLRPIEHVITAASQIERGADLDKRIQYDGPNDEIGRLTHTINGMLARLQHTYGELNEAYKKQRRFVSDASHELRTPLTTIRGNIDLMEKVWAKQTALLPASDKLMQEDGHTLNTDSWTQAELQQMTQESMADISSEAERMSRLVNDMLSLARADAGFDMEKQALHLQEIVTDVVRKAQYLPKQASWNVGDITALDEAVIVGNTDYLKQMLFIFIENAFKYTPEGEVELTAQRSGNQIGIQIRDTGIGLEEHEITHIFDRFYRADPSRGKTAGTGLGLAIAKWIIDEHHGSIEVFSRKGSGTTFLIWLPVQSLV